MRRWHEDYPRVRREWQKHYRNHIRINVYFGRAVGRDPYEIDCACDGQKGRFRKMRAFGCGRPRCQLCHSDKYPRREHTRQERLAALTFYEGLTDGRPAEPHAAPDPAT
jgi:hypothetical protein